MAKVSRYNVVVLDRIYFGVNPGYVTWGKATCVACGLWCWLGSATGSAVASGYQPLCLTCAKIHVPSGTKPDGHLDDEVPS